MNKREYKQLTSILLARIAETQDALDSISKEYKKVKNERSHAVTNMLKKGHEVTTLGARNAELRAKVHALEARESEVNALRQQHAESYTRKM